MKQQYLFEGKPIMYKKAKCTVSSNEDDLGDEDAAFKISSIMNSSLPCQAKGTSFRSGLWWDDENIAW